MSEEVEQRILREVEEEVRRILRDGGRAGSSEKMVEVHYLKSMRDKLLRELIKAGGRKIVIAALDREGVHGIREGVLELSKLAREMGGELYFIRWPALLITIGGLKVEVHE